MNTRRYKQEQFNKCPETNKNLLQHINLLIIHFIIKEGEVCLMNINMLHILFMVNIYLYKQFQMARFCFHHNPLLSSLLKQMTSSLSLQLNYMAASEKLLSSQTHLSMRYVNNRNPMWDISQNPLDYCQGLRVYVLNQRNVLR